MKDYLIKKRLYRIGTTMSTLEHYTKMIHLVHRKIILCIGHNIWKIMLAFKCTMKDIKMWPHGLDQVILINQEHQVFGEIKESYQVEFFREDLVLAISLLLQLPLLPIQRELKRYFKIVFIQPVESSWLNSIVKGIQ